MYMLDNTKFQGNDMHECHDYTISHTSSILTRIAVSVSATVSMVLIGITCISGLLAAGAFILSGSAIFAQSL